MIRGLAAAAAQTVFAVLEYTWGWRGFEFGPPTADFTHTVFGNTSVQRGQAGLSLKWEGDSSGLTVMVNAGPLHLDVTVAGFDAAVLSPDIGLQRGWTVGLPDGTTRDVHVFTLLNHLGGLVEWDPPYWRVSAGPLGISVEPSGRLP